jgi:predicted peroxiredoxin
MRFLKSTADDMLTLKADGSKIVKWYADAGFAVHPDFQSHTGAVMKMGNGAITSISCKQGMNTRSSTEAEVVAADEVVGAMFWTKLFLQASARIPCGRQHPVSRQPQHNVNRGEWATVSWEEVKTFEHLLVLRKRPEGEGKFVDSVLSH